METTHHAAGPQDASPRSSKARPGKARAEADLRKRWHSNKSFTYHALLAVIQAENGNAGLPDNTDSRHMLIVIGDIAWHAAKEPATELRRVVPTFARWCDVEALIGHVEALAEKRGRALTAKEASKLINFTYERWKRAARKPFDPCDKTPRQMDAIRRKRSAERSRTYRKRQKAKRAPKPKPTPEMVEHLMATHGISRRTAYYWIESGGERRIIVPKPKPWEAFGCSRATWYRRGRPAPGDTTDCTKSIMSGETVDCTNHIVEPEQNLPHEPEIIDVSSGETVSLHKMRHNLSVFVDTEGVTRGESADVAPTDVLPDGLGGHRQLQAEQADGKEAWRWEVCGRPVLTLHTTRVDRRDAREAREFDGPRLPWMNISDKDERRRAIFARAEADLRAFDAADQNLSGRAA